VGKFIVDENSSLNLDENWKKFLMEKYQCMPVTETLLFQLVTVFAKSFNIVVALHCEECAAALKPAKEG